MCACVRFTSSVSFTRQRDLFIRLALSVTLERQSHRAMRLEPMLAVTSLYRRKPSGQNEHAVEQGDSLNPESVSRPIDVIVSKGRHEKIAVVVFGLEA